jgi:DNA end-binding protein Ku
MAAHPDRSLRSHTMARAMWKGAIQFGLVTIPVKLYVATESKSTISFNLLHDQDLSRIQMKVWCPVDEAMISRSDTVRGYEYAPGEYVVVTDDDLEHVPLKTVRSIEIEQFVPRADAEDGTAQTRFVKQAYYVEPDKIGRKAFMLLREVLAERGLTAICKVVIKDREALAALDPFEGTMLLTTLHWPDEIRSVADLDLGDEAYEFKPAERAMAAQLVEAMTGEFDPAQYRDEYQEALRAVIESKIEGREVVEAPEAEPGGAIIDLMAALEASVKAAAAARDAEADAPVPVSAGKRRAPGGRKAVGGAPATEEEVAPAAARRRRSA